MQQLKRNFTQLIIGLFAVMFCLIALSLILAKKVQAAEALPVPVSINALMVTLIDHSAHYIWDYGVMERAITDEEWLTVEYYAIQLAGGASLITVGGSGFMDEAWVEVPAWKEFAKAMSDAAMQALEASKEKDKSKLLAVGDMLIDSCEGCHSMFKPGIPTESIMHQPDYDFLYHLFR